MKLITSLLLLCGLFFVGDGAKILGVWPMPAPSHFILGQKLLKSLAARGHEVTMISPFPQKTPVKNWRDISLDGLVEHFKKDMNLYDMNNIWTITQSLMTHMMGSGIVNYSMSHPNVQKLLNSNEKFDLVITELFSNEFQIGFSHKYQCPHIILSTLGSNAWTNGLLSNPAPYSYVPDLFLQYSSHMNFWERLHNTYFGVVYQMFRNLYYIPMQDRLLHTYFKDAPPLTEMLANNISLMLLNSHPATFDALPHVPAMVEIGGYHVDDPKPLPKDLKDFMDNAKDGVILFSMGSNLKSAQLPAAKRDAILKTFAKLKQKVIWKWEEDVLAGQPPNVKLSKWLPQNDLMAHPNLKAFITHGGLLSTIEAIHHGIPIVGIPIFGDQKMNMAHAVLKKYGIAVYFDDLTEETLTHALNEIINNPLYRNTIRQKSNVLRDQPLKPIDNAIFWVEHVLRHKGASHLRCAAQDLQWYQLYLLDVYAFTAVLFGLSTMAFIFLVKKCCCGKKTVPKKDKKKKTN